MKGGLKPKTKYLTTEKVSFLAHTTALTNKVPNHYPNLTTRLLINNIEMSLGSKGVTGTLIPTAS